MLHGLEILQIEQLVFQQTKEVFNDSIVQTISFSAGFVMQAKEIVTESGRVMRNFFLTAGKT